MNNFNDNNYSLNGDLQAKFVPSEVMERVNLLGSSLLKFVKAVSSLALAVIAAFGVGVTSGEFQTLNQRAVTLRNSALKNSYDCVAELAGAIIHPKIASSMLGSKVKEPLNLERPAAHLTELERVEAYRLILSRR